MCDITTLRNLLIMTLIAIVVATGLIAAAIIVNPNITTSLASVALMYAAAGATALAWAFAGSAILALNAYCNCLMGRCEGLCSKLRYLLTGVVAVLVVEAYYCLVAAGVSWIPGFGIPWMAIILGALSIEAVAVTLGIIWLIQLATCGQPPAPAQ